MTGWRTFTAAGAVVVKDGAVLMVRQRRAYGVHWEFPSGYDEGGETLEQTAEREVLEETGLAVEVGEFVCTLVWQRQHDLRRNVVTYFLAAPVGGELRPQVEEGIDAVEWIDAVADVVQVHPLNRAILDRWWQSRDGDFHLHADIDVAADGTQTYSFA